MARRVRPGILTTSGLAPLYPVRARRIALRPLGSDDIEARIGGLGKIDVHGPDAGKLLDRLYINTFSTLPIGKARYGIMLREDGFVMDDGTTTRFAEDRFFVTTTTANAAKAMQHIDYARQVLWPELDVQATSTTEQWSTYSVAGPRSRALLQKLLPMLDLSNEGFRSAEKKRCRDSGRSAL